MKIRSSFPIALVLAALVAPSITLAQNVRLTNDTGGGYVSTYTLATGTAYTDAVLTECSIARGRPNEPAVAVDPRHTTVLLGGSSGLRRLRVHASAADPRRPDRSGSATTGRKTPARASRAPSCRATLATRPPMPRWRRSAPRAPATR
jgi:hypothetical protein